MQLNAYLQKGEHLYAVLNGTLTDKPISHYSSTPECECKPLWLGTPYQEWHQVMPMLLKLPVSHAFVDWARNEAPDDWGFFIISSFHFDEVFKHMQSLTQVYLPNKPEPVFFRFFDPENSLGFLKFCNEKEKQQLMGPCLMWISNNVSEQNSQPEYTKRNFPWWKAPEEAMESYTNENKNTLILNLIQWLKESQYEIYENYSEVQLKIKLNRIITRNGIKTTPSTKEIKLILSSLKR